MCISDRPPRESPSGESRPAPGDPRDAALKTISGIVLAALADGRPGVAGEALRAIAATLAAPACGLGPDAAQADLDLFARLWWTASPD